MCATADSQESEVQAVLIDCGSVIFMDVAGARLFIQVETSVHQDPNDLNSFSFCTPHMVNCFFSFSDVY